MREIRVSWPDPGPYVRVLAICTFAAILSVPAAEAEVVRAMVEEGLATVLASGVRAME